MFSSEQWLNVVTRFSRGEAVASSRGNFGVEAESDEAASQETAS